MMTDSHNAGCSQPLSVAGVMQRRWTSTASTRTLRRQIGCRARVVWVERPMSKEQDRAHVHVQG